MYDKDTVDCLKAERDELAAALRQIAEWAESATRDQKKHSGSDTFPAVIMAEPTGKFARAALAKVQS